MSSLIKKADKKKNRQQRQWWITNMFQNKIERDGTKLLSTMVENENTGYFKNFTRMDSSDFEFL